MTPPLHISRRLMVSAGNAFESAISALSPTYYWKMDEVDNGAMNGVAMLDYGSGNKNLSYVVVADDAYLSDVTISAGPKGPGKDMDTNPLSYTARGYAQGTDTFASAGLTSFAFGGLLKMQGGGPMEYATLMGGAPIGTSFVRIRNGSGDANGAALQLQVRHGGGEQQFESSTYSIQNIGATSAWQFVCGNIRWNGNGDQTDADIWINGSAMTLNAISFTPAASAPSWGYINFRRGNYVPFDNHGRTMQLAHWFFINNGSITNGQQSNIYTLLGGAV